MDEAYVLKRRVLGLTILYGVLVLLPTLGGVLLSFTGQPGGITQANAFLAPFLGPWSRTLPPNRHPVSTWSPQYDTFAKCLGAMLVCSVISSYFTPHRWLRYFATVMAVVTLVLWTLAGLAKVVSQLA